MLIVADGAPGLIEAIEQCWPASDRQHCCVHRVRNQVASCPNANASASASATSTGRPSMRPTGERDAQQRLQALVGELDRAGYTAAARCSPTTSTPLSSTCTTRS